MAGNLEHHETLQPRGGAARMPPPRPGRDGRARRRMLDEVEERETLLSVLAHVMPRRRAAAATDAILAEFGDFAAALGAEHAELSRIPQLRAAGADLVKAIHSAALHLGQEEARARPVLNSTEAALAYLATHRGDDGQGRVRLLFLDPSNRLIADETMGDCAGGELRIEAGEILRRALRLQARSFILVHADPQGGAMPRDSAIMKTHEVQDLAETIGLMLQDHIVLGRDGAVSMRRLGLMRGLCRLG